RSRPVRSPAPTPRSPAPRPVAGPAPGGGRAAARPSLRPASHDPRLSKGANMVPSGQPKGNVIVKTQRSQSPMTTQGSLFGLSPNVHHLETSATIAISQEAKRRRAAGEDVIDLGAGEPDFPTPSIPADAGIRAIKEGKTHYPATEGILELRAAAAKHLSLLSGGRPVNADHIVVSSGSKQSLFNACFTLFGPGEVVAIPAPAWVSYPQIVHLARARPVLVSGDPEWSLKVSVKDLDRVVPGAQGLMLCSPCNPTGGVYTHGEIRAIAEWARKRGVWVIADEIYRRIHYGTGPAPSFLDLPDE